MRFATGICFSVLLSLLASFRACLSFNPGGTWHRQRYGSFQNINLVHGVSPSSRQRHQILALHANRKSEIELGIQAAQLLLDNRRHDILKKKLSARYPIVPGPVLDTAIRLVANGFSTLAPAQLKLALKPGGMEQIRPQIERAIVSAVLDQPSVQSFALLNRDEKRRLLETLVDMCLDQILEDADWILSAPEVRLEELEDQVEEVKREMGLWRLLHYRVRRNPVRYSAIVFFSSFCLLAYQQGSVLKAALSLKSNLLSALIVARIFAMKLSLTFQAIGEYMARGVMAVTRVFA